MKYFRWLVPALGLLVLSGCFQIAEVLHINPDGSGTVEETVLISKTFMKQMDSVMGAMSDTPTTTATAAATPPPTPPAEPMDLYDPEMLRKQAGEMGEGVTFQSGQKVDTADFFGFTAVYAFTDINKLNLNNPSSSLKVPGASESKSMQIDFQFKKGTPGSPATLTIGQPGREIPQAAPSAPPLPATPPASPTGAPDEAAAKLMSLFKGMRFQLAVDINGFIVSTNAAFREGNRITILDCDFDKLGALLSDPEMQSKLQVTSLADAKAVFKGVPGVKVDMNDKLTVVFDKTGAK